MGSPLHQPRLLGPSPVLVVALSLLAVAPGPTSAQQTAEPAGEPPASSEPVRPEVPLREQVAARLVLVPVTVTDGRRRPILDLGPRDFLLRVDGRPIPLASFDPPQAAPPRAAGEAGAPGPDAGTPEGAAAPGEPAPPQQPSHIAFVLDLDLTRPAYVGSGVHALEEALSGGLPARTRAGLFLLTRGTILQMVPFTDDVASLLAELETLPGRSELQDTWILEERDRLDEIDGLLRRQLVAAGEVEADLRAGLLPQVEAAVRSYSDLQASRVRRSLAALAALAAGMERLRGRRAVVLLTEGLREQAGMNYARGFGDLAVETVSLRAEFQALARVYQTTGISLSPVSLVGLFHPGARDPEGLGESLSSLQFLARGTGGRKPVALNDFTGEVAAAVELPRATYVLGFEPIVRDGPGTVHRIQVRALRPGLEVTARSEYVEQADDLDASLTLAGAAAMPEVYRDLALVASVRRLPGVSGEELLLQLELPLEALTLKADGEGRSGSLMVAGLLRDASGRSQVLFRSPYDLFIDAEPVKHVMVQESGPVLLQEATEIVAVLWDRRSDRIGTAVLPLPPRRDDPGTVRVSRPVLLVPSTGVYLLTPSGRPSLGIGDTGTLFLPGGPGLAPGSARLAMARVAGLPAGAAVRFCLDSTDAGCVAARLTRPPAAPAPAPGAEAGAQPAVLDAWVALDAASAGAAEHLRIEIVDPTGAPLADGG